MAIQEIWNARAKERAETNSLARDLHRVFTRGKKTLPGEEGCGSETEECLAIDNCKLEIAWQGLTLKATRLLSSGTYGKVYAVEGHGCQFAAKVLKPDCNDVHGLCELRDLVKEAGIHWQCASAFVVPCVGLGKLVEDGSSACLLMEVCGGGRLWDSLDGASGEMAPTAPSFKQRLVWSLHIAAGLCHLHSQKVIHLDLKLDNTLLASDPLQPNSRAKITDFGMAKVVGANNEVVIAMNKAYASPYRPPECTRFVEDKETWPHIR